MYFLTHLAAAAVVGRWSRLSPAWLVVGAALPDLVDKPLGTLGVVDLYHTVGHTALLAPLAVAVALTGRAGLALAVGWASHLFLDAFHIVINGRPTDALFLVWPLAVPPDPLALPPGAFFRYYLWSPSFFLEVGFWVALVALAVRERRAGRSLLARREPGSDRR